MKQLLAVATTLIFLSTLTPVFAADTTNLGPLELSDQFPLSLYHLSPIASSAEIIDTGTTRLFTQFAWTNTATSRSHGYIVDSESRILNLAITRGISSRLELGLEVPLMWQGGGTLDHLIKEWHSIFGLPQGDRDEPGMSSNRFLIAGENQDNSTFDLTEDGYNIGDINLQGKYQFLKTNSSSSYSVLTKLRLPTATNYYQQDSIDYSVTLLGTQYLESFTFYEGAGNVFVGDLHEDNISFNRYQPFGFFTLEYKFLPGWSAVGQVIGQKSVVSDVKKFPDYAIYLDFGLKTTLNKSTVLELACRENPAPGKGTTDVVFVVALSHNFD